MRNSTMTQRTSRFMLFLFSLSVIIINSLFAAQIEPPTFNYTSGKYDQPLSVFITSSNPDDKIYYTTDGTTPDTTSACYDGKPILVLHHFSGDSLTFTGDNDPDPDDENKPQTNAPFIIKAIAVDETNAMSDVSEVQYIIDLVDGYFNIPYADPPAQGGTKHQLDVYQPKGKTNTPVAIFIHGGAWKQGDKNLYMELGNTFAGYYNTTVVNINYQLSCDPWYAVHPTHIQDVALGVKWVFENIESYGGNPNEIYVFGQSAGAHLISLLATDSTYLNVLGLSPSRFKAVIPMSGTYDMYDLVEWPDNTIGLNAEDVIGYKALCFNTFNSWDESVLDSVSPAFFVNQNQPPFHIISLNESETFHDMPGFVQEAKNFYNQILFMDGPEVTLQYLSESDIPQEILDLTFSDDEKIDGHYEEIYAINTKYWNSVSSKMVAEIFSPEPASPELLSPENSSMTNENKIHFEWKKENYTYFYQIQISSDSMFTDSGIIWDVAVTDTFLTFNKIDSVRSYFWRVKSVNFIGESDWSPIWKIFTATTGVQNESERYIPQTLKLDTYPNPFNSQVKLKLNLNRVDVPKQVDLKIYNILGNIVFSEKLTIENGQNFYSWKPQNFLTSGIYFVEFNCGRQSVTKQILYLK